MNLAPRDEEDALRQGLTALARDGGEPVADVGGLLGLARRSRRLRTVTLSGAGAALVLGGASVAALSISPASGPGPAAVGPTPSQYAATSAAGLPRIPAVTWTPNPTAAKSGPGGPQIGVPYPFDLLTHCGIRWTSFGGRTWATDTQLPEPPTRPDPRTGTTTYTGYTAGFMTLLSPDTLRFDAPGGVTAVFHPIDTPIGLCD